MHCGMWGLCLWHFCTVFNFTGTHGRPTVLTVTPASTGSTLILSDIFQKLCLVILVCILLIILVLSLS